MVVTSVATDLLAALQRARERHLPDCPECLLALEGDRCTRVVCHGCGSVVYEGV